jgi:YVTN family beta-propeller protein
MVEVFISYSRTNRDFVDALYGALLEQAKLSNYDIWVDWEDIDPATDWWAEIREGIDSANNFLFVVSPNSLISEVCNLEFQYALQQNKYIIPIIYIQIEKEREKILANEWEMKEWGDLALENWSVIKELDWVQLYDFATFEKDFEKLIRAINANSWQKKAHTRLSVRARDWETRKRNTDYVLRGDDLKEAEVWFARSADKQLKPTKLHREYIVASRKATKQGQTYTIIVIGVFLITIISMILLGMRVSTLENQYNAESLRYTQLFNETGIIKVGKDPSALAWDGTNLWIVNQGDNTVQKIDVQNGKILATIVVDDSPSKIMSTDRYVWVITSRSVQRIDPTSGLVTASIHTWFGRADAMIGDETHLWVAGNQTLLSYDENTVEEVKSFPSPRFSSLLWDGPHLWGSSRDNLTTRGLYQIDPETGVYTRITQNALERLSRLYETYLWGFDADNIYQFEPTKNHTRTFRLGFGLSDMVWDGVSLWATDENRNTLYHVDPESGNIVSEFQVGNVPSALIWDGQYLWVANKLDNTIQRVDPESNSVISTITIPGRPEVMAWDGTHLWVNGAARVDNVNPPHPALYRVNPETARADVSLLDSFVDDLIWDGTYLWILDQWKNTILVFDVNSQSIIANVSVDEHPSKLAWDGTYLWVLGSRNNVIQKIDTVSMSVIDTILINSQHDWSGLLAWDGNCLCLWASASLRRYGVGDALFQLDPETGNILNDFNFSSEYNSGMSDMIWGGGYLWVSVPGNNALLRMISEQVTMQTFEPIGSSPTALAWDGTHLWIVSTNDHKIIRFDGEQGAVNMEIPANGKPGKLFWDGVNLWVAYPESDELDRISVRHLELVDKARNIYK